MIRPFFIFEITARCDHHCRYCYNIWKNPGCLPPAEIPLDLIKGLFDRLIDQVSFDWVMLSGGEPLLYPQIMEVVAFLKTRHLKVGMATGGRLLDASMTGRLDAAGIDYLEISLDSLDPATYQRLTGADGLDAVMQAVLNVKGRRIPLTVAIVLTQQNISGLTDVLDFCCAASVDHVALNRFVPGGRGLRHVHELLPSTEELKTALRVADDKAGQLPLSINVTLPIEPCKIPHRDYPHLNFGTCGCGLDKWVIDPAGHLRICEQHPVILGNLLARPFAELSAAAEVQQFRKNNQKNECRDCPTIRNCGGGCRFL